MDDRALARALAAGDPAAFRAFVEGEATPVLRICHRILGSLEEAEDATQDVFVLAYRALGSYRGDGPPGAWVARIAARECWRRRSRGVRRGAVTVPLDETTTTTLAGPADPERDLLTAEQAAAVRDAVASLQEPYREVVALRYFGELSVAAIATATGRPEGTVKAQLHRGLERLRSRLGEVAS
jgi:RNA polymerase sigma-70 factor (ECF subfamily)